MDRTTADISFRPQRSVSGAEESTQAAKITNVRESLQLGKIPPLHFTINNHDDNLQTLLFQPNRLHLPVLQTVRSPKFLLTYAVPYSAAVHLPGTLAGPVTHAIAVDYSCGNVSVLLFYNSFQE